VSSAPRRPRILIIGAGFGGLTAAQSLAKAPADILLIDRRNYHLFQPLLYQVATAALSPAEIAVPIRAVLRGQENITILMDEAVGIDTKARLVRLRRGSPTPYDHLILATGSAYSYFGHEDWPRFAPGLKSIDDATRIRAQVLRAFEEAETCEDEAARRRLMSFVLVGAGPTGVEMAGALAELAHAALARDFRHIVPKETRILLVEAGPRILASFPDRLSQAALRSLRQMRVEVALDTAIEAIDEKGVIANGKRIAAATVIWCAGVSATPVASWLGVAPGPGGALKVAPDLSVPGCPEIFVIGDAAFITDEKGRRLPGVAPSAKQQGHYVGDLLRRRLTGKPAPPPFRYRDQGQLATIGRARAVADLSWMQLWGFPAWLLWGIVHIYFLIGFRNRVVVFLNWFWAWLTYGRGARLITGERKFDSTGSE